MATQNMELTLYAGNTTVSRVAISKATEAEVSKAANSLLKEKLVGYMASKTQWDASAVGTLSYAMAAYMVEVIRRTRMQVWVPPEMKTQIRVTTGTLSTAIVANVSPYVGKSGSGSKTAKMAASIVITHSNLQREERSQLLSGVAGQMQEVSLYNTHEPVSDYTESTLESVFGNDVEAGEGVDLQQIWLSMVKKNSSLAELAMSLLDLPDFVATGGLAHFNNLTRAIQEATLVLRAENESIIQQSAVNRVAYSKQQQAGEGADKAMDNDDVFIPF